MKAKNKVEKNSKEIKMNLICFEYVMRNVSSLSDESIRIGHHGEAFEGYLKCSHQFGLNKYFLLYRYYEPSKAVIRYNLKYPVLKLIAFGTIQD